MASRLLQLLLESPATQGTIMVAAAVPLILSLRRAIRLGLGLLAQNPLLQQLVGVPMLLGGVGAIGLVLRTLLMQCYTMLARKLVRTVRMDNKDENYNNVINYISQIQSFESSTVSSSCHPVRSERCWCRCWWRHTSGSARHGRNGARSL